MPPIKTYTFKHFQYPSIELTIDSYSLESAISTLKLIVKNHKEFILN